jgi:hypothetical protein
MPRLLQVAPLALHITWTSLSREGKIHRLREAKLWADPPEYYTNTGEHPAAAAPR